jgi:hypothetical protein
MSMGYVETRASEAASFGGLVDAIGGLATIVLAIVALTGVRPEILVPITVIVFGAALLIQGGAMVSEYALFTPAAGAGAVDFGANSLSSLFLVGAAGIVLGVLALLGIATMTLVSISVIAFGAALLLSSNSVRNLYLLRRASTAGTTGGGEMLASEMASGSAAVQLLAGLTAVVLGILAVSGTRADTLVLAAMIVLGATVVLSGSALSSMVIGFMRPTRTATMP